MAASVLKETDKVLCLLTETLITQPGSYELEDKDDPSQSDAHCLPKFNHWF